MATYNLTGTTVTSGVPSTAGEPWAAMPLYVAKSGLIDLSGYATTDGQLTAAAVLQVLSVPANTLVLQVAVEVATAAVGTTLTANVGDGSGADSWNAAIDIKTAGTYIFSTVGTDAYASASNMGKFYSTADTIDLTIGTSTAITAGPKFRVFALCADYN
jgi:hypothetical protein